MINEDELADGMERLRMGLWKKEGVRQFYTKYRTSKRPSEYYFQAQHWSLPANSPRLRVRKSAQRMYDRITRKIQKKKYSLIVFGNALTHKQHLFLDTAVNAGY